MYGTVHNAESLDSPLSLVVGEKAYSAFDIVSVAASAGGLLPLRQFLSELPCYFPAPIVVVYHLPPRRLYASRLKETMQRKTRLKVKWVEDGEVPRPGVVYLAPQDRVTVVEPKFGSFCTTGKPLVGRAKAAADPLFRSTARAFGRRAIAVVLSGALADGAEGAFEIVKAGGCVLAQSYRSAEHPDMPHAAIARARAGLAFDPYALAHAVVSLVMVPGAAAWFRVGDMRHLYNMVEKSQNLHRC